jgi:uncharacterized protein YkwD
MPPFRQHARRVVLTILLAAMWGAGLSAGHGRAEHYPDLPQPFLIDAPLPTADPDHLNSQIVIRQRGVDWREQVWGTTAPERILFNLFENLQVIAVLVWSEAALDGARVWIGRIEGYPDSRATLVIHGRQASAILWVAGRRFDLRPTQGRHHVIQELDADQLPVAVLEAAPPQPCRRSLDGSDPLMPAATWMSAEEEAVLLLVNQERAKYTDRPPLAGDQRLVSAARAHSQDMSDNGYFSHTSLDGRSVGERITAAGYAWNRCGENIARGYPTPEAVMSGWMNSEGHRSNILSSNYCDLGVGYVAAGRYWTQNFARRQGVSECPAALTDDPAPDPAAPPDEPDPDPAPPPQTPAPSPAAPTPTGGSGGGCFLTTLGR